jgi:hypothetical protein
VGTNQCVVPQEIQSGEEFYVVAVDEGGEPVKIFTEENGAYKRADISEKILKAVCIDSQNESGKPNTELEFNKSCALRDASTASPSSKNSFLHDQTYPVGVIRSQKQITTILLTKGPNRPFHWPIGIFRTSGKANP